MSRLTTSRGQSRLPYLEEQRRNRRPVQGNCEVPGQPLARALQPHSPENKDTSTVVVALGFNVTVGQQEDRENDHDDIPTREDQPVVHNAQCQANPGDASART